MRRSKAFQPIGTSLHLPAGTVDDLRAVAGRLLLGNEDFQEFLAEVQPAGGADGARAFGAGRR